ncbi:YukJ family protein [Paenibacillus sp. MMS20-IR301]|uniref:YukJ family protein n=1 Tax=Paenibacillus sp. MMS20-IR301 TaxID=2895946 RepID=UPI0028EA2703|nr:YukJ family protein [Paenibacillus sp. MMS20-IR301]WNS46693.1 YukJ family protein [Paenibacillus sp. MMS20-IR301]
MPLNPYGVLKGKIIQGTPAPTTRDSTPHYHAVVKAANKKYKLAINVQSKITPSELLYLVGDQFNSEQITHLQELKDGFTKIDKSNRDEIALDYIRGGLFDPSKMIALPYNADGPDNDLNEKVDAYLQRAIEDDTAKIYVYGEPFPGGIHNIHMNQGNVEPFVGDDGIWQDGGIVIHFEQEDKWLGLFLAFQSQSWCTDDQGHMERPVSECSHKTHKSAQLSR